MLRHAAITCAVAASFALLAQAPGVASSTAHAAPARSLPRLPAALAAAPFDAGSHRVPGWMSPKYRGSATFVFPKKEDTHHLQDEPWMWHEGDYVEGTRQTALPSVSSISGVFQVENDMTDTGYFKFDVVLNDRVVGTTTMPAAPTSHATTTVKFDFKFPHVLGPVYRIRYVGVETVESGKGSFQVDYDVTEVTLK